MSVFKSAMKTLMAKTPYRISRTKSANRFEAFSDCLAMIAKQGFAPTRIVDAGANVGSFAKLARHHFHDAKIDMIEPQPACEGALREVCELHGLAFHPFALVAPDAAGSTVEFIICSKGVTTGARLAQNGASIGESVVKVRAQTLDDLLDILGPNERLLLKLDLEGNELEALKGSMRTLKSVEVIVTESAFFGDSAANNPFALSLFLQPLGFALYDVLSISGRARDNRARQCDLMFVKSGSLLDSDCRWN